MDIENAYRSGVEAGHISSDFGQRNAVNALKALAVALTTEPHRTVFSKRAAAPRGVYLWGPVGAGKSMLMDMFADHIGPNVQHLRTHFHDFMAHFHSLRHADTHVSIKSVAPRMTGAARVLCFDEFTITHIADAMVIKRLFEEIFARRISVVATSNQAPQSLYAGGLNVERFLPFIPVLLDHMTVIAVNAQRDYRRGGDLSLWLCGPQANSAMERLWQEKTNAQTTQTTTMQILGRTLHVQATCGRHARLSFADLCQRPLGTNDYLALAARFDCVFITDIPTLTATLRSAAIRLTALIDVLYDKQCTLVVSAQQPSPDDAFMPILSEDPAFKRTVSRLNQMCSLTGGPESHADPLHSAV